jgi:hypothetical protein
MLLAAGTATRPPAIRDRTRGACSIAISSDYSENLINSAINLTHFPCQSDNVTACHRRPS